MYYICMLYDYKETEGNIIYKQILDLFAIIRDCNKYIVSNMNIFISNFSNMFAS